MKKILLSIFVLSILLPTLAFASFDTSLKYGSRGDAVLELQDLLVAQGFLKGKSDGKYGLVTVNAVKAFQTANGLSADGYFGKASRVKASSMLASQLQSSNTAEQTETGTIAIISTVAGCTSTSAYSATTGQPCNSTIQPSTPNLPAGCISTSGFSTTTGQSCNGVASTIQQLQQTVQQQAQTIQQIQQNTQQLVQNTTPVVKTPQSMKDIQVENLTQGDVYYFKDGQYGVFNFKITVLDDNGNKIPSTQLTQNIIMSANGSPSAYFGMGSNSDDTINGLVSFSPNHTGDYNLTFSYAPLNLSKTLTVTAK